MKLGLIFFTLMLTLFLSIQAQAQVLDISRIVPGTVQGIQANSLEVRRDSDNRQLRVTIDPNTVYDNVQQLSDIKIGDKVQVKFHIAQGKNTAITVKKVDAEGP